MRGLLFLFSAALLAQQLQFKDSTVTAGLNTGYQLVAADLNADGKLDLVALDERGSELAWFEAPKWEKHILAANIARPINLECYDVDGDRIPECAIAFHFESNPAKSIGDMWLYKAGPDVRQPWTGKEIDRTPTAHRIRWIDLAGNGKKMLLLAPLVGATAQPPLYDQDTPVFMYRPGEWKREVVINDLHGVAHAIQPVHWKGKGESLLAASFQGLRLYTPGPGNWKFTELSKGDPRPCPECGASEVRLGKVGKKRVITTIEPWHGNQVVVYVENGKAWDRTVIEDSMINGHALAMGDVDGDGKDEIVAGFRGKGYKLFLYKAADATGKKWTRTVLDDGGIAAADCKILDFTGDGKPDIACIGASTGNVKLYTLQTGR
ncbi:MAG: VCBS repeat-containing protein [Acidobacteria bacterium]|nr:VCBS repeat-containing protein [Acidobacteriota bacterium]